MVSLFPPLLIPGTGRVVPQGENLFGFAPFFPFLFLLSGTFLFFLGAGTLLIPFFLVAKSSPLFFPVPHQNADFSSQPYLQGWFFSPSPHFLRLGVSPPPLGSLIFPNPRTPPSFFYPVWSYLVPFCSFLHCPPLSRFGAPQAPFPPPEIPDGFFQVSPFGKKLFPWRSFFTPKLLSRYPPPQDFCYPFLSSMPACSSFFLDPLFGHFRSVLSPFFLYAATFSAEEPMTSVWCPLPPPPFLFFRPQGRLLVFFPAASFLF